jgi:hypothetical protein
MRASPTRAGAEGSGSLRLVPTLEERSKLGLEGDIGRIEHLPASNDDHIETARRFVVAKQFAHEAFGPISHNGRAHFSGRGDAQPGSRPTVRPDEHRHQASRKTTSTFVELFEIFTRPDVFVSPKARHRLSFVGHRQALAPFGAPTLQDLTPVLGRHSDQKTVGFRPSAVVRLKRTLALLGSRHIFPRKEPLSVCPFAEACKGATPC